MIGQVIGNYRIVSELGKGGMGMVYRAEHTQLGKAAAVKMLLPQFSADPTIVQRFFNEARAASAIEHPGIVEIFDFGSHTDGAAYIAMALLKGESLEQRLRRGPLPPLEGASLVAQVLGALAAAHARGIIHRDLKPDNIFLTPNEMIPGGIQTKLLDFGIAKLANDTSSAFKTQTGMMMGTPAYMSPEQCMGRADLDHRTDLYAIGCILFHVLTGRPPFVSDQGTGMMIAAHMRDPAPPPRTLNPHVPDALAAIVMRLLEKEPAARYQSALEARQALVDAGAAAPSRPPAHIDHQEMGYAPTVAPRQTAPTTASGSAGEMMAQAAPTTPTRKQSKASLFVGFGVLAAAGIGVAVWASQRGTTTAPAPSAVTAAGKLDDPPEQLPAQPTAEDARPQPQGVKPAPPPPRPRPDDSTAPASPAPSFTLDAKAYDLGATIHIKFASPVSSPSDSRAWITIVEATAPPTAYGNWVYVEDRASTAKLAAPSKAGAFEVRLHTDYPKKSTNLRHSVAVKIGNAAARAGTPRNDQRFMLASKFARPGDEIELTFPVKMHAADDEKFWVTVVDKGASDTAYGTYAYVPDGAKTMLFKMPSTPGDYEIRLHANYPRLSTNLVHRAPIRVED